METDLSPPAHLTPQSKEIWAKLVPARARSIGRLALLQSALEAKDRAEMARAEMAGSSLTTVTKTTGTMHCHPLLKIEREARAQFASIWTTLALNWISSEDGVVLEYWLKEQEKNK